MARIKVMVSPFYSGEGWLDKSTGINFEPNKTGQPAIYSIPEGKDLSGIKKAIQINSLFLVEGTIEELKEIEVKEPKKEEEKEEPKEEPVVEIKEEEEKEEPKKTTSKRSSSRSKRTTSKKSTTKEEK